MHTYRAVKSLSSKCSKETILSKKNDNVSLSANATKLTCVQLTKEWRDIIIERQSLHSEEVGVDGSSDFNT